MFIENSMMRLFEWSLLLWISLSAGIENIYWSWSDTLIGLTKHNNNSGIFNFATE